MSDVNAPPEAASPTSSYAPVFEARVALRDQFRLAARPLLVASVALIGFLVARWLHLRLLGPGIGNDVYLYQRYATAWGGGSIPYVGFQPEYPPGALPFFLVPWLFSGNGADYARAFAVEMAIFDLAAYLLVLLWGRRLRPGSWLPTVAMGACYLAITAALYPVLYTRFDIVPGALVLGALTLAYTPGRLFWSAVLLGLAGAVKLWPLGLGPAWLLLAYRRRGWGHLLTTGVGLAIGLAIPFAPLLPKAGWAVLKFLEYHSDRGIEIGSIWASLALLVNMANISDMYDAWTVHDFGAFHVKGPVAATYARWSMWLLPVGVLLPQVGAFFGQLGRKEDERGEIGIFVTLGAVAGFMVFGKVLSPQFALWLAPLMPLACRSVPMILVAIGIAIGTTIEYPFMAASLEMLAPGHKLAVSLVAARNLLLIILFIVMCRRAGWAGIIKKARAKLRPRPSPPPSTSALTTSAAVAPPSD